ncbi:hypothetical protein FQN60_011471 [Etheostoma spectabile]|uniref:Uncharacterized protein n=1 Tax=Etheostoma spectabile TaxID=54343 RepID=A0A5J5CB44_9PERO|nr:hypothetical protein FQN60_011471 [Etheostoma spectabile]
MLSDMDEVEITDVNDDGSPYQVEKAPLKNQDLSSISLTVGELLSQYGWYLLVVTVLVYLLIQHLSKRRSSQSSRSSPPQTPQARGREEEAENRGMGVYTTGKELQRNCTIFSGHWRGQHINDSVETKGRQEATSQCRLQSPDWTGRRLLLLETWQERTVIRWMRLKKVRDIGLYDLRPLTS